MALSNLVENKVLLLSVLFAILGWFLEFIGICILQGNFNSTANNNSNALSFAISFFYPLSFTWWVTIYHLLVVLGLVFAVLNNVVATYRLSVSNLLFIVCRTFNKV